MIKSTFLRNVGILKTSPPFDNFLSGFSVMHTNFPDLGFQIREHFSEQENTAFQEEFPHYGGRFDMDLRLLALRAVYSSPSIQNQYARCVGARYSPQREFPVRFLTDLELMDYENRLDDLIERRRRDNIGRNCLSLYFDDLNVLYQAKNRASIRWRRRW